MMTQNTSPVQLSDDQPDARDTTAFLTAITKHRKNDHLSILAQRDDLNNKGTPYQVKAIPLPIDNIDVVEVERILTTANSNQEGVFITTLTTNETGKRTAAETFDPLAIIADYDGGKSAPTDEEFIKLGLPLPSCRVQSGGGQHCWWWLSEGSVTKKQRVGIVLAIALKTEGDTQVHDCGRYLRIPGSVHWKYTSNPKLVHTLEANPNRVYGYEDFSTFHTNAVEDGTLTPTKTPPKRVGRPSKTSKVLPAVIAKIDSYDGQIPAKVKPHLGLNLTAILECVDGHRNVPLYNASQNIARMKGLDSEIAFELCLWACEERFEDWELVECETTIKSAFKSDVVEIPFRHGKENSNKTPTPLLMAKQLVNEVLSNTIYDSLNAQWMLYGEDNGIWVPVSTELIFAKVQHYLEGEIETFKPRYIDDSLRFAKSYILSEGWEDAPDNLLPFENGVLNLETKQLLSYSPDHRLTWQLPRQYSVDTIDGGWDTINNFLDDLTCKDTELKNIALAVSNVVLTGKYKLHKFLNLIGKGGTGKGTFLSLLTLLVGDVNTHSTSMYTLENNQFESANLKNKKLLIMGDEREVVKKTSLFFKVTGGDPIRYERKGKDATNFTFNGLVTIAANKPIFTGNDDSGLKRRYINFPCNAKIPKLDDTLIDKLAVELSSFTNYILSLSDDWVKSIINNANNVEAVKELNMELATHQSSIAAFCESGRVKFNPNYRVRTSELYQQYKTWCSEAGRNSVMDATFGRDLIEYTDGEGYGVTKKRSASKEHGKSSYFYGLGKPLPPEAI
jgi:P4 family phage/plasmid primase-like protien